jgi:hypothetical protein
MYLTLNLTQDEAIALAKTVLGSDRPDIAEVKRTLLYAIARENAGQINTDQGYLTCHYGECQTRVAGTLRLARHISEKHTGSLTTALDAITRWYLPDWLK